MREIILDFPKQFKIGIEAAKNIYLKSDALLRPPENIIICGMGGSGLPGEILATFKPLDIFVYKSYRLPPQARNESLIICISYSGNTEETLSSFMAAVNRRLPVITITTGGKLEKLSKEYAVPCVKLPSPYIPPRLALGEMFAALSQVLQNNNLLDENIIKEILKVGKFLKSGDLEKRGKILAKKIFKKIPIIYTSRRFMEIGWIWKNCLNETAKIIAFANYFPELNHNETVGFEKVNQDQISNEKLYVIILRDKKSSHSRVLKQMDIAKDIIEKEGVRVEFIDIKGEILLEKIFSTIILGFWTAYWLAIEYKVDPTEIKTVEEFKKRLAK
ncbi:MAG: bifunctional phosphoglucose/phosphomannose isomerase [bacterium]|nr:bifunctional phosphoglucose/phosphomannose isomerase [bacterium]